MDPIERAPREISLGALDAPWDGLTFASSITNSDRDSLSPEGSFKPNSDIVSFQFFTLAVRLPDMYQNCQFFFSKQSNNLGSLFFNTFLSSIDIKV